MTAEMTEVTFVVPADEYHQFGPEAFKQQIGTHMDFQGQPAEVIDVAIAEDGSKATFTLRVAR